MWLALVTAGWAQTPTEEPDPPATEEEGSEIEPARIIRVTPKPAPPEEEEEADEEPTEEPAEPASEYDTVTVVVDPVKERSAVSGDEVLLSFGVTYGAYAGGATGYLVGEALEGRDNEAGHTTQGITPGALGGAAIGGTTAYLIARANAPSSHEAQTLLYTTSAHGILYGSQLGRVFIAPGAPGRRERIHAAGLAGSMLGVGMGTAFGERASSLPDQARFTLATGVGWLTASGINDLGRLDDDRARGAVVVATAAGFGGLGALANRTGTMSGPATLGLSLGHGAWVGGWSPLLFRDDPDAVEVLGGVRLGVGAGYASALLMSAFGEPSARSAGMQVAGWAAASALGAGLPLALGDPEAPARNIVGPMLAAGVGGQVLGAALSPHYDIDAEDGLLLGTLGAWTTYQAIGWGVYGEYTTPDARRPFGYLLSAAGAGSLLTLGLTPLLDVEPSGSLMLLSSGGWGTWYGAWGAQLADLSREEQWLITLGSGDGTLLASGVALGAGWRPTWSDLAYIDGLGLVGAAAGGLVGVIGFYDPDDPDPLVLSTLVGSTAGLVTGGVLAAIDQDDRAPTLGRIRVDGWRGSVSAMPLPGQDGTLGGMVRVNLEETRR